MPMPRSTVLQPEADEEEKIRNYVTKLPIRGSIDCKFRKSGRSNRKQLKIMKQRISIIIIALALAAQAGHARGFDRVFDEFRKNDNVMYMSIPPFLTWLGKTIGGVGDMPIVNKAKSVKMLIADDCSDSFATRFNERVAAAGGECEELVRIFSDGDILRLWMEAKGDKIKKLVILTTSDSDCMLLELKGNFKKSDIAEFINESIEKKKR